MVGGELVLYAPNFRLYFFKASKKYARSATPQLELQYYHYNFGFQFNYYSHVIHYVSQCMEEIFISCCGHVC